MSVWFPRTTDGFNTWYSDTAVQQDFVVQYTLSDVVTADFVSRYDITLTGDWGTLEINATLYLLAQRDFFETYDVYAGVTADFAVAYSVEAEVSRDFFYVYQVDGTLPAPVSRDFTLAYDINADPPAVAVSQDFIVYYMVEQEVSRDFLYVYQVDGTVPFAVTRDFALIYTVESTPADVPVSNDFIVTYRVEQQVIQDFYFAYTVDGTLPAAVFRDFPLTYAVLSIAQTVEVSSDFSVAWKMDGVVIVDALFYWDVFAVETLPGWTESNEPVGAWIPQSAPTDTWTQQVTTPTGWN